MRMNYEEAVDYVLQTPKFTKKNTPEDTRRFFAFLGRPGEKARIAHVAGTNGKGSVCAYMSAALTHAGFRTGLFTSPHLVDIRERIRMDGKMIEKEEFAACVQEVLDACMRFRAAEGCESYHPTFFELLFFAAMLWFEQMGAEMIVLETGLGGRLDATNVIEAPAVTAITRIGLDHMEYLGNTKEQIAGEKAGIIKEGRPVVYLEQEPEVCRVIVEKAKQKCAKTVPVSKKQVESLQFLNKTVDFSMHSEYYEYIRVSLHTAAFYQRENAALAVRALEQMERSLREEAMEDGRRVCERHIRREDIEEGLAGTRWEARMDEVFPGVVIDGAHNEDGIHAFLESVGKDGCQGKRSLLFSAVADKRSRAMAQQILDSGLFEEIVAAPLSGARALDKESLEGLWRGRAKMYDCPEEAFRSLIGRKGPQDMVYAAGSLYLAGQLLADLRRT